jgi:hypothetical protein
MVAGRSYVGLAKIKNENDEDGGNWASGMARTAKKTRGTKKSEGGKEVRKSVRRITSPGGWSDQVGKRDDFGQCARGRRGGTPYADESRIRLYREGKIYKLDNGGGKAGIVRVYPRDAIEVTQEALTHR